MKNYILPPAIFLSCIVLFSSCGPVTVIQSDSYSQAPAAAPAPDLSYQSFYDDLSPYGDWITYPGYGYVWMPNEGPDFQPYATNGNWIYTDAGWTWASNYSWGWAPFHYGRWFYENGYGWLWMPGNEWAPAWVSWRGGGDYYGWAPMGPNVSVDVALNSYNPPPNYWNFVPRQYMGNPNWHNYYVGGNRDVTIINNTTIINNYSGTNRSRYSYAPGPDPNEVRKYSGNNFTAVQIRQANTPGARMAGAQYEIYQPRVSATAVGRGDAQGRPSTPAPTRYQPLTNVRPSTQYPAYSAASNSPQGNHTPEGNNVPRPAVQNPVTQQPAAGNNNINPRPNPPANERPWSQGQTNQPAASPQPARPATNPQQVPIPSNNADVPLNNHTTVPQNPAPVRPATNMNQAANNHPVPVNPANNQKPAVPHSVTNPQLHTGQPANHNPAVTRPATVPNPNHPVQKPKPPVNKPDVKQVDPSKTKDANPN